MNKENMLKIADAIEAHTIANFRMVDFFKESCGTSACVAGFAHLLMAKETGAPKPEDNFLSAPRLNQAADYLGLEYNDAYELFHALSLDGDGDEDTYGFEVIDENEYNHHGAKVLRWMAENDNVNWKEALTALGIMS